MDLQVRRSSTGLNSDIRVSSLDLLALLLGLCSFGEELHAALHEVDLRDAVGDFRRRRVDLRPEGADFVVEIHGLLLEDFFASRGFLVERLVLGLAASAQRARLGDLGRPGHSSLLRIDLRLERALLRLRKA